MNNVTYSDVVTYWKKYDKNTENDYSRLLSSFWLLSTCDSNNIEEGKLTYHVTREVFEGSTINISGVYPKDIVEAQNSDFVRRKVIRNLINKTNLTPDLIKLFHKTYMNGLYDNRRYDRGERPGQYKVHDYVVGVSDVGSLPEDVPGDVMDLCNEVINIREDRILEAAAYFHLVFETIHPFSDGNGRIGRLIMNYLLMLKNHPPINIFSEDKETYYMALEVFNRTGEILGFVEFLKEQCIKTWKDIVFIVNRKVPSFSDAIAKMEGK